MRKSTKGMNFSLLCVYPSIVDNPKLQNHSVLNNSSTYTLKIEKPKCRNPREKEKIEPLGEVFFLKMFMVSEKLSNSQLPSLRRQNQYLLVFCINLLLPKKSDIEK